MAEQEESRYFNDVEHVGEMARLTRQARVVGSITGLFPQSFDLSAIRDVLDVASGPGVWAQEIAQAYPHMQVTGIDISHTMTDFATSVSTGQSNIRFQIMDATKPLDFPDQSFDLVNARFIFGFTPTKVWPLALQEWKRILRPGGALILTEGEMPMTNKTAVEQMSSLFIKAMQATGQSFSPIGRNNGITPMLSYLLVNAGFESLQTRGQVFDFTTASEEVRKVYFLDNYRTGFHLMLPFLVRTGVTTEEEVDELYNQMVSEMEDADFCATGFILTAWGYKPQV